MKHTLLALLFLPLAAFSQTIEMPKKNRFWLGLSFSPDLTYRTTTSKNEEIEKVLDDAHIPLLGYTGGLNALFQIDNQLELETGLQFSKKGFRTEDTYFFVQTPDPVLPVHGWFEYHFSYLDIPVKLNYKPFKKGKFFLAGGIATHLKLTNETVQVLYYADGHREEKEPNTFSDGLELKPINVSVVAGFGIDLNFGESSKFRIEPLFRHMITPVNDGIVKIYLWSAGLNLGFYHRLR